MGVQRVGNHPFLNTEDRMAQADYDWVASYDPADPLPVEQWEKYAQQVAGGASHAQAIRVAGLPRTGAVPVKMKQAVSDRVDVLKTECQPDVSEEDLNDDRSEEHTSEL